MHIGKYAQCKKNKMLKSDSISKANDYLKDGWVIKRSLGMSYMYEKELDKLNFKPYYCPILTALIYAQARIDMYDELVKVPLKDLIYTDTDSVVFKGNHLKKFKISDGLGDFKIEEEDKEGLFWALKTYRIGDNIRASGVPKESLDKKSFDVGYTEMKKRYGFRQKVELDKVGTVKIEGRDFKELSKEHKGVFKALEGRDLFIDMKVDDFSYFLKTLNSRLGA